ncbi:hypothetical protein EB796_016405 [Bugula neritina]|uniref:PHD-type domain-containing protein n=1 Tax=Bugula neritina TaxID=10212 RepID=A0A7J7JGQ6_BUGNE|nr:hypothetical protein EB796_016405 [Bugula neritina]
MAGDRNTQSQPQPGSQKSQNDKNKDSTNPECKTCNNVDCYVTNTRGLSQKFGAKWIQCDFCDDWFHGTCQSLTNSDVATLDKMDEKNVKWFCNTCLPVIEASLQGRGRVNNNGEDSLALHSTHSRKPNKIEDIMQHINAKIGATNTALKERMTKLEKSYADAAKSNTENLKKGMEISDSARNLLKKSIEQRETENRKNNAIIYGIDEQEGKSALKMIKDLMMSDTFHATPKPLRAIRLQTSGPVDKNKPRPIKIEFLDEYSKWEFLKRTNATLRGRKIYCKLDECKEIRDQQYALRQEIKQMKGENSDTDQETD